MTHGRFDDAGGVGSAGVEDGFEVGECLFGLWADAAVDDLCGGGDEWDAAGDEDEVAGFDCLGVGADCRRGSWKGSGRGDGVFGGHTRGRDGLEGGVCRHCPGKRARDCQ